MGMKNLKQLIHNALFFVAYLPLTAFLTTYRVTSSWPTAFGVGGAVAVISLMVNALRGVLFERFLLAANIFLIGGGLGVLGMYFDCDCLMNAYRLGMQSTLLVALLLVGLVTTFATKAGFLGVATGPRAQVRLYSLYLLGATVIGTCWSIYFTQHGGGVLAGFVPFVALKVLARLLVKKLK